MLADEKEIEANHRNGFYPLPVVAFDNGEVIVVSPIEWKIEEPCVRVKKIGKRKRPFDLDSNVLASRRQLPLLHSWALSIHMSQGLTIARLCVDLEHLFAVGQGYVALSRAQTLDGLLIRGEVPKKFSSSDVVEQFYGYLYERRREEENAMNSTPPLQEEEEEESARSLLAR